MPYAESEIRAPMTTMGLWLRARLISRANSGRSPQRRRGLDPQGVPTQSRPATYGTVIESIPVIAPPGTLSSFSLSQYTGANTNSVTLSPDEKTLYVTNGNLNNIAVVALNGSNGETTMLWG